MIPFDPKSVYTRGYINALNSVNRRFLSRSISDQLVELGKSDDMRGAELSLEAMHQKARELAWYRDEDAEKGPFVVSGSRAPVDFHCSRDMYPQMVVQYVRILRDMGFTVPDGKIIPKQVFGIDYFDIEYAGQKLTFCNSDVHGHLNPGTVVAPDLSDIICGDGGIGWTVVSPNRHWVWRNCKSK